MSEKRFSTDEIVATVMKWRGWDMDAVDEPAYKEIIARLHAADVLCEAAERARKDFDRVNELAKLAGVHPFTLTPKDLDNAIADYEGKEE